MDLLHQPSLYNLSSWIQAKNKKFWCFQLASKRAHSFEWNILSLAIDACNSNKKIEVIYHKHIMLSSKKQLVVIN